MRHEGTDDATRSMPAASPKRVPQRHRTWPWDRGRVLTGVLILSMPLLLGCGLGLLWMLVGMAPSEPCTPATSSCGPGPISFLGVGFGVASFSLIALVIGWAPRIPTALRISSLVAGLAVSASLAAILIR